MDLTLQGYAIGNGILTVENEAQALARADPAQARQGRRRGPGGAGPVRPARDNTRSVTPAFQGVP